MTAPPARQPSPPLPSSLSSPPPSPFAGFGVRFDAALARGIGNVVRRSLGPHQTAVVRIGFAFTWLVFLLREWPHRSELYGPDSPWGLDLAGRLLADNHAFTILVWSDSAVWFECVYHGAMAACVLLLLGWRTRASSVLFMLGVLSLQNRSVFMGDGGDNVIHLMAMYLVITRCGQVWSLDSRRRARGGGHPADPAGIAVWAALGAALLAAVAAGKLVSPVWTAFLGGLWLAHAYGWLVQRCYPGGVLDAHRRARGAPSTARAAEIATWAVLAAALLVALRAGLGEEWGWTVLFLAAWLVMAAWTVVQRGRPGEARVVTDVMANTAHNVVLLVIMFEVCLIYATAGWYKIQGSRWQDGTAVFYPMNLDYFAPWPELSAVLGNSGLLVMALTYGTVFVQVAFPFALLNRRAKNLLLFVMIGEHVGIALLLGLPFFSLAMIAMDIVFLPTVFLLWLGDRTARLTARVLPGGAAARGDRSGGGPVPAVPQQQTATATGAAADGGDGGEDGGTGDRRPVWARPAP